MQDLATAFLEKAKIGRKKIAIGILRPIPETVESLRKVSEFVDLVVVGAKVDGFENIVEPNDDEASKIIISLLKEKKVDGIVRGQVKDSFTLDEFYRQFEMEPIPSNRKVCPAILQKGEFCFVSSTASVYQGMNIEDKKFEVERIIRYMKEDLGITPKIGIMSTLRPTSKVGKYKILNDMAVVNSELASYLRSKGYDATEYFFEYETAVWNHCNLIVPATGLVGNAWVKALLYLGDWKLLGINYLDLGVVYEDGTRNEKDFYWHVIHAVAMANSSVNKNI